MDDSVLSGALDAELLAIHSPAPGPHKVAYDLVIEFQEAMCAWAALPLAQHTVESPQWHEAGVVQERLFAAIAALATERAALEAKRKVAVKELANLHHDAIVAMQAAYIEWQHGGGAVVAMGWIANTLDGPGLIPDPTEPYGTEAQAYMDANRSDPFPQCFCGRPSNIASQLGGFCSDAHYAEAKAKAATPVDQVAGGERPNEKNPVAQPPAPAA